MYHQIAIHNKYVDASVTANYFLEICTYALAKQLCKKLFENANTYIYVRKLKL